MADRVRVKYVDAGSGEVSLPGYMNAIPSIISPGDVFEVDSDYADVMLSGDDPRWKPAAKSARIPVIDDPADAPPAPDPSRPLDESSDGDPSESDSA